MTEPTDIIKNLFQRAEALGLERDLPRLSGLDDDRIDAIRSGEPASTSEFEMICRALAVDSGAMYRGDAGSPNRSPVRFRTATAINNPSPTDVRLLALAAEQGRILSRLMALLGREVGLSRHKRAVGIGEGDIWRQGYELGEAARAVLAPDDNPISDLPGLLNDAGVHVAQVDMTSKEIDAASVWEPAAVPIIMVNANSHVLDHPGVFHATLAHELCHLLHDAGERDLTTNVSWGAEGTGNYHDNLEVRARAFAPAFLAPRGNLRNWYDALPANLKKNAIKMVKSLAETWGFSFEGAAWHAKNCGFIESEEADRLAGMPRKPLISLEDFELGENFHPPVMFHPELPEEAAPLWRGWASIVVLDALEKNLISVGRARELLTWR